MTTETNGIAETEAKLVRELREKKDALLQDTFIRAVAEGWPKFYFWHEPWKPGDTTIAMHCGPTAPANTGHEVYDVAECEAKIDALRKRTP